MRARAAIWAALFAGLVAAETAPTTRALRAPEPDPRMEGEGEATLASEGGYQVKLGWWPQNPAPGDLIRLRVHVTAPEGSSPVLVVNAEARRVEPKLEAALLPKKEIPSESTPSDGRYVFTQVFHADGLYEVSLTVDDLAAGKTLSPPPHQIQVGRPQSNGLVYGIGIAGVALIVLVLAFGLRKPAAAA
jgi:hypothetical protein